MSRKRSQKWYNKHEVEVLKQFGLTPTKRSGAGWVEKEDGYNDEILAQLKSTDADSFKFSMVDWRKLEYHSMVEHKKPLFIIDFIDREQFVLMRKEDLKDICLSLLGVDRIDDLDYDEVSDLMDVLKPSEEDTEPKRKTIKSSKSAREKFHEERLKQWRK